MMMSDSIYIISDINSFHKKIREVSYWHFIVINNNQTQQEDFYFSFKVNNNFKKELKLLLSEKESYLILEKYLKFNDNNYYINNVDLDNLIKDVSFRICCNIICKIGELDLVDVLWDAERMNFSFRINSNFIDQDVTTPEDFLKNIYKLSIKYLKLKNHYKDINKLK